MHKAGREAQLGKADRQGRNDHVKRGTLPGTLAKQNELSTTPCRFLVGDPRLNASRGATTGWCVVLGERNCLVSRPIAEWPATTQPSVMTASRATATRRPQEATAVKQLQALSTQSPSGP
jgi:hypothetical protein